jgi:light-regulated signal transduction histidine kinase (bacteriophytochrome)
VKGNSKCASLEELLREIVSVICINDKDDLEGLILELKDRQVDGIAFNEIIGHQLMQKINFIETHLLENEWMGKIVKDKKSELIALCKRGMRDHSKFTSQYEN